MRKPVVGVMGASAHDALTEAAASRLKALAESLGAAIAKAECILVTGATTGLPDLVAQAFRKNGGFALGVSPAENRRDHVARYGLPEGGADVIIYTGFGYKGQRRQRSLIGHRADRWRRDRHPERIHYRL